MATRALTGLLYGFDVNDAKALVSWGMVSENASEMDLYQVWGVIGDEPGIGLVAKTSEGRALDLKTEVMRDRVYTSYVTEAFEQFFKRLSEPALSTLRAKCARACRS
jgi:hypothetical protein